MGKEVLLSVQNLRQYFKLGKTRELKAVDDVSFKVKDAEGVKSISGMGLMIGIETEREVSKVIAECRDRGVLVIKAKNKVRLLPALNIEKELLETAINVLLDVLSDKGNGDDK